MSRSDGELTIDPALAAEIALLDESARREVEQEIELRGRALRIATELGLDPHDVRLVLKCLALPASERLRRGLIHGRRRSLAE